MSPEYDVIRTKINPPSDISEMRPETQFCAILYKHHESVRMTMIMMMMIIIIIIIIIIIHKTCTSLYIICQNITLRRCGGYSIPNAKLFKMKPTVV